MIFKKSIVISLTTILLLLTSMTPVNSQTDINHALIPDTSRLIGSHGFDYLTSADKDANNHTTITGYFSYPIFNVPGSGPTSLYDGPFYDTDPEQFIEYPVQGGDNSVHYSGSNEIPITKLDNNGDVIYSKYIGGNKSDIATDIVTLENGKSLITGYSSSTVLFSEEIETQNQGGSDGFLMIIDEEGDVEKFVSLGGSGFDFIQSAQPMSDGSIVAIGSTNSLNFPLVNSFQNVTQSEQEYSDLFVVKYDKNWELEFSTVIGGNHSERVRKLLIDENDNIYVAGISLSNNYPTFNSGRNENQGNTDAILLKFDRNGTLLHSSYFGGQGIDWINDMAFLSSGKIVTVGATYSPNFPASRGLSGVDSEFNTEDSELVSDGFFAMFDRNFNQQITGFLGGSLGDDMKSVVAGEKGFFYVTGETMSPDYPIHGPFERPPPFNGELLDVAEDGERQIDLVMTKVNETGRIAYSIFYGGYSADSGQNIIFERVNNTEMVTIIGYSSSSGFPTTKSMIGGGGLPNGFYLRLEVPEGFYPSVAYPGRDNTAQIIFFSIVGGVIVVTSAILIYRWRKKSVSIKKNHDEYREKYDLVREAMKQN